ncbi:hypothetical protein ACIPW5_22435 [Streptomyces sp. NPDC090077]|uniref:hypothetical protein n=1 Tax=Streptomyces sp. NPDC090077 TaxID=3365938 RepID=UPI0038213741
MRTPTRIAGVLTGLALSLGGAAVTAVAAPAVRADIPACVNMAAQAGAGATEAVTAACTRGVSGDLTGCVDGLTQAGVPGGAAGGACRLAALEPR